MSDQKRHPSVEHLLQFFSYHHLPAHLQEPSRRCAELAEWKDCLVRASMAAPKEG